MNEIEERVRDAFDADAQTVRPESLRPPPARDSRQPRPAGRLHRGRLVIPIAAAAAVAAIVLAIAVVVPGIWRGDVTRPSNHDRPNMPVAGPLRFFLTVATSPAVINGNHLVKYQVFTLALRSIRDRGRPVATLLRSLGSIDAVFAPDGSVIAVVDYGCRSQVFRIDPRTGNRRLLRTLRESAGDIALSPDGQRLAYLTYPASDPQPCGPAKQPASPVRIQANPGGLPLFLPSVLAVVNLSTGTAARAASVNPGQPPWSPSWSPDGKTIAVVSLNSVELLSATHPDFAAARQLRPPRGCGYVASTWTVSGILAVLGCGKQNPALSPRTLVRLSAAGQRGHSWRLPACIDGVGLITDPAAVHVLVQANIGYGNGPGCGLHQLGRWTSRVAAVGGSRLRVIAVFPQRGGSWPQVTGW